MGDNKPAITSLWINHYQALIFIYLQSFENTVGKGEIACVNNFSFFNSVFYSFGELSAIFIEFKIVVCKLFEFGSLKFVILQRV